MADFWNSAAVPANYKGPAASSSGSSSARSKADPYEGLSPNEKILKAKQIYAEAYAKNDYAGYTAAQKAAEQARAEGGTIGADQTYAQGRGIVAQDQVNKLYDAQREQRLAALRDSRNKALGEIDLQRQAIKPQYQQMRSQADTRAIQAGQRLKEIMAAQGLNASGENVTANIGLNTQRNQTLTDLDTQEQQQYAGLDQRVADINSPEEENALMAALEADRAQALIQAQQRVDEQNRLDEQTAFERSLSEREANAAEASEKLRNEIALANLMGTYNGQPTAAELLRRSQIVENQAQAEKAARLPATKSTTPKTPSVSQQNKDREMNAVSTIQKRLPAFSRPIDFVAQIQRELAAGQIDPYTAQYIIKYMRSNYADPYAKLR